MVTSEGDPHHSTQWNWFSIYTRPSRMSEVHSCSLLTTAKPSTEYISPSSCKSLSALECGASCHLAWVISFLSNRQQRVRVSGVLSNWFDVWCGVPQGTQLGPVGFLAMMNDAATDTPGRWKFVDNITLSVRGCEVSDAVGEGSVQGAVDGVSETADRHRMQLNADKTVPPCWCRPVNSPRPQPG